MKNLKQIFLDNELRAKFIYNSNAIEGSTITLGDTKKVLEDKNYKPEDYSIKEVLEVIGLNESIDYLMSIFDEDITVDSIVNLHYHLMNKVEPEKAGVIRDEDSYTYVDNLDGTIKKHWYTPWEDVYEEFESLEFNDKLTLAEIVKLKCKFCEIHPFYDGNGRTSRLLLNWLLIKNNFKPVDINGDEVGRNKYIRAMANTNKPHCNYKDIIKLVEDLQSDGLSKSNLFGSK